MQYQNQANPPQHVDTTVPGCPTDADQDLRLDRLDIGLMSTTWAFALACSILGNIGARPALFLLLLLAVPGCKEVPTKRQQQPSPHEPAPALRLRHVDPPRFVRHSAFIEDRRSALRWHPTISSGAMSAGQALPYCNRLAGSWRLPHRLELASLVDHQQRDCAIDQRIFGPTPPRLFWSSDRPAKQSPFAWGVLMRHGGTALVHRNVLGYVRCVRGRPPSARDRWRRQPKAVRDALTELLWQADALPSHYNHANAMRACRRLATALGQPWRLPTSLELQTLVGNDEAIRKVFPDWQPSTAVFWSESHLGYHQDRAFAVDFRDGQSVVLRDSDMARARCVRDNTPLRPTASTSASASGSSNVRPGASSANAPATPVAQPSAPTPSPGAATPLNPNHRP